MKKIQFLFLMLILILSCNKNPGGIDKKAVQKTGTMSDKNGNVYKTVKIGKQWWMAENLKTTYYRNGEPIPLVSDNTEWTNLSSGAYCYYNNSQKNGDAYGFLYNWYAVNDSRNIAPEGWHVPTDDDWKELENELGMKADEINSTGWRGTDQGGKLKEAAVSHWEDPNSGASNESGFSAIPGGYRYFFGWFEGLGKEGVYWAADAFINDYAWYRGFSYQSSAINRDYTEKRSAFSVRLVKD